MVAAAAAAGEAPPEVVVAVAEVAVVEMVAAAQAVQASGAVAFPLPFRNYRTMRQCQAKAQQWA